MRSLIRDLKRLPEDRLSLARDYLRAEEGRCVMSVNEQFAEVMAAVMKEKRFSLEQIKEKAPRGFWGAVKAIVDMEGPKTPSGMAWKDNGALSNHWKRDQAEIEPLLQSLMGVKIDQKQMETFKPLDSAPENQAAGTDEPVYQSKEILFQKESESFQQQDLVTRQDLESLKTTLREEIREQLKELHIMASVGTMSIVSEIKPELSPTPAMDGKRHTVKRAKLGGTVDPVLYELIETEARKRGVSVSRLMDAAFWHFFGRPKLSFEAEEGGELPDTDQPSDQQAGLFSRGGSHEV
jgi:hypothetical protein